MRTGWTQEESAALVELIDEDTPHGEVLQLLRERFGTSRTVHSCYARYRRVKGLEPPETWGIAPLNVRILLALQATSTALTLRELAARLGIMIYWDDPGRDLLNELRKLRSQGLVRRNAWHWTKTDKGRRMLLWGPNAMTERP